MTSSIPGIIAWPVAVFMVIVVAARYRWCDSNLYDHYFNNTLAFLLVTQLLRDQKVEDLLSKGFSMTITMAQQLSVVAMMLAGTEFIGFTMLWSRISPEETRCRHRYYRLATIILCTAFLTAATRARVSGETLEVSGGWDGVLAWSFYLTVWFVLSARIMWMCGFELAKLNCVREFLVVIGGLLLGVVSVAVCMEALALAVSDQLGWTNTVDLRLRFHGYDFDCEAMVTFIIGAVPLAVKLASYLGLDPISRNWRKLQPLRHSMTTVVPESSFDLQHDAHRSGKTILQLHQSVIQIRDAILQLRPYFRDTATQTPVSWPDLSRPTRYHPGSTVPLLMPLRWLTPLRPKLPAANHALLTSQ